MDNAGTIKVALAGNPNCGKTTIFNNITGAKQHVGNYPGVTVEKKEGRCNYDNHSLLFVDLPGTYSLTARSLDEVVARNVIINEKPDIIVNFQPGTESVSGSPDHRIGTARRHRPEHDGYCRTHGHSD